MSVAMKPVNPFAPAELSPSSGAGVRMRIRASQLDSPPRTSPPVHLFGDGHLIGIMGRLSIATTPADICTYINIPISRCDLINAETLLSNSRRGVAQADFCRYRRLPCRYRQVLAERH
jgi:hypothetical protein